MKRLEVSPTDVFFFGEKFFRSAGGTLGEMLSLFAFVLSFVAYLLLLQQHPYGDGILYLEFTRKGVLAGSHLLYMPGVVGFTRLFEGGGLSDRQLGFIYSAFTAALGNAFLLATLRRYSKSLGTALLALALVALAPSTLFFATTVEVHGQHYGLVCVALYFFCKLVDKQQPSLPALALAGLIVLLAPLSHETGWMLLAFFLPMAVSRFGREELFDDFPTKLQRSAAFLLFPALLWVFNHALRTWLFVEVFQVPGAPTGNPSSMELYNKVLHPANQPEGWLPFLWKGFFRPAWGVWLALLVALPLLARRSPARFFAVSAAFVAYVVLLTLYGYPEKGAYFVGFLPIAAFAIAQVWPPLPTWTTGLAFLVAIQSVDAIALDLRYPSEDPYPLWAWAQDVQTLRKKQLGGKTPTVFAKGMFQAATLRYELGIPAEPAGDTLQNLARSLENIPAKERASKRKLIETQVLLYVQQGKAKGPLLLSQDFVQALRSHFPRAWQTLKKTFPLKEVHQGKLRGFLVW
ncbi:MAG TPA: hypothetical protein ENK02_03885 [Planctomycetes bacterium]|nr:hypothetical protein [Planctomycetota bacterium]